MNIGILGTGKIAHTMAKTISRMNGVKVTVIGSRTLEKAKSFAEEFEIPFFFGSYEEAVKCKEAELYYIASPHSKHYEDCMLCLENGKHVLCEKAFTANEKQAEEIFTLAESKGLFVSEAIWTRFMPMRYMINEIMQSGVIGKITTLSANLGYSLENIERLVKPELAGGALLDVGVYPINFALMAFGNDIKNIVSSCNKNEFGVDRNNSIIINFKDGKTANIHSSMQARTDRRGIIFGDKGRIEVENVNNPESIKVIMNDRSETFYERPKQITGYEYEVEESVKAIESGKTETDFMPHKDTLFVMHLMDSLRNEWGIKYPFE